MHYVIIGAGPAGITAAETLRKLDGDAEITVIGDEPEPPYSRMALPYYLIGQIDEQGTFLRKTAGHYGALNITFVKGRVAKVAAAEKSVYLRGGRVMPFDKLLIATGSRPIKPPVPGIDRPGIQNCWTLADGRNIAKNLKPGARVVLMGAGFIGCIILEALFKSGATVSVVEMEERMVPRMMNDKAAGLIKQWCFDKGVNIHTGTKIVAFEDSVEEGAPIAVKLDTGETVIADCVVVAAGVQANIDFLADSGIATEQGILVNHYLQTSAKDIYAAGDVAQGLDFSTGEYSVQAIQPTAVDHAQLAARNMAGDNKAIHQGSINMNVLDTMGLIACSFGLWMGVAKGESVERYNPERYQYINLQFDDEYLVGATAIGLTQHVGVLRGLIQSRIKLGEWKPRLQQDPTRIMEAYLGSTQALGFNAVILS
jgi:NAD(P)H-nitrite reductase large subunit